MLFNEDGFIIEEENEVRMQKYFVAFSFDTPRENQSPLTMWSWCFAKTKDKAFQCATDRLEKIHKDQIGRKVDKIWLAEFTNLQDPLKQVRGDSTNNGAISIITGMLTEARKSYNVRQKGKPRIKLNANDIPPWEVAANRQRAANRASPTPRPAPKPKYIPYSIVSGGDYLKSVVGVSLPKANVT